MKRLLFFRKRWRVAGIVILLLTVATSLWFPRNYHFYFDSHHHYEEATFRQWLWGWFGGFEDGPLYAAILEGPKIPRGDFTHSTYQWHLNRGLSAKRPKIGAWVEEKSGLRFAVVRLKKPHEFLIHCWQDGSLKNFRTVKTARHVGGQPEVVVGSGDQIWNDVSSIAWIAGTPTRWSFFKRRLSGPQVGTLITIPENERPEDWVFHFEVSGDDHQKQRFHRNFVLKFDAAADRWDLLDLDEDPASWIEPDKAVKTTFPNGFDPS